MRPIIQAIIFDLDSCLSAPDEVGRELREPGFEAMEAANRGVVSTEQLQKARDDYWRMPFDKLAEKYHFSPEMIAVGWSVFSELEISEPMKGYPDLVMLHAFPEQLFLVTTGFRKLQESKVRALGIRPLFREVVIDAIDEAGERGKEAIFQRLLRTLELSPDNVLVVGDNLTSEIAAGNRLGCRTVQILRPGVIQGEFATYVVYGLVDLQELIKQLNTARLSAPD